MTTKRTYVCNFCRGEFGAIEERRKLIIGLHWAQHDILTIKRPHEVENHLCRKCMEAIADVAKELPEAPKA